MALRLGAKKWKGTGMTQKHHEDCPYHDDFQGINNVSECYCGVIIGDDDDMCVCDCMCEELIVKALEQADEYIKRPDIDDDAHTLGIVADLITAALKKEEDRFV